MRQMTWRAICTSPWEVVGLLLAGGAEAGRQDADGECALHKAAARGMAATCAVLLHACPAAAALTDRKGMTPAERAPDAATRVAAGG